MQQPVIVIDASLLLVMGSFGVILYLALRLRDLRLALVDISRRYDEGQREILRLSIQLAALQRGAIVSDELASALDVDAIHEFGANGGVKTYILLAGDRFSMEDLTDIAFRLGVDLDALAGDTRAAKARELVRHMVKNDRLADLKRLMIQMRPALHT